MRAVALFEENRPWMDAELLKDCGLIPFLLYKEHGCVAVLAGRTPNITDLPPGTYGNADKTQLVKVYPSYKYVDGEYIEVYPVWNEAIRILYLLDNAKNIDYLLFRGPYQSNWRLPALYHKLNPYGRVYCGLDMNLDWFNKINWNNPSLQSFMSEVDVLATSCTNVAKTMSDLLPWKVNCIPNGSYQYDGSFAYKPDWHKRKNRIITVARLGTVQKRTDILLLAFALISPLFPSWTLECIGGIEDEFKPILQQILEAFPDIKDKVIFDGYIFEREKIIAKYRTSKIFALPSNFEGGTPNAAADAISCGCVTCVTMIDAWKDITHDGGCGLASPIGDIEAFANNLALLCANDNLQGMSDDAFNWGQKFYNMSKIVSNIYGLLNNE